MIYPPIDSLQEFKIEQNNYSAELWGRAGQVLLTAKAGRRAFRKRVRHIVERFQRHDLPDYRRLKQMEADRETAAP